MESIYNTLCNSLNVDACVLLGTDPHHLAPPHPQFQLRHYLSNFHGSAGTLVIYSHPQKVSSALWTDSRYKEAAQKSIPTTTDLFIDKEDSWINQIKWIVTQHKNIPNNTSSTISIAFSSSQLNVTSYKSIITYIELLESQENITIKIIPITHKELVNIIQSLTPSFLMNSTNKIITPHCDWMNTIWILDELQEKFEHLCIYTEIPVNTSSSTTKYKFSLPLTRFKKWMRNNSHKVYLSSNTHEIAWLLGIRSLSISYLMVFPCIFAYHTTQNKFIFWVHKDLYNTTTQRHMSIIESKLSINIEFYNYNDPINDFKKFNKIMQDLCPSPKEITYDEAFLPLCIYNEQYTPIKTPLSEWKSIRTSKEINYTFHACLFDSIAIAESICEISKCLSQKIDIKESEIKNFLYKHREKTTAFLQESFCTIAAVGPHTAMPHYDPKYSNTTLDNKSILLLDTGAHYIFGTTDITRVFYFADIKKHSISHEFIEDYTYVLKAHIGLATYNSNTLDMTNPQYPTGSELDNAARNVLLTADKTYAHGTGHGVGMCTDVHEGVQRISPTSTQVIKPNMIMSNEPALYKPSKWGIRIETLMNSYINSNKQLALDTISFFPIQTSLVDKSLLNKEELNWLEDYNKKSLTLLAQHINPNTLNFLKKLTQTYYKE